MPQQLGAFLVGGIALAVVAELAYHLVQRLHFFSCDAGLSEKDLS